MYLTKDMKTYRKNYYKENKDYLLAYSKWYYTYLQYEKGKITYDELQDKPKKTKFIKKRIPKKKEDIENNKKKKDYLKKIHGDFIVSFN